MKRSYGVESACRQRGLTLGVYRSTTPPPRCPSDSERRRPGSPDLSVAAFGSFSGRYLRQLMTIGRLCYIWHGSCQFHLDCQDILYACDFLSPKTNLQTGFYSETPRTPYYIGRPSSVCSQHCGCGHSDRAHTRRPSSGRVQHLRLFPHTLDRYSGCGGHGAPLEGRSRRHRQHEETLLHRVEVAARTGTWPSIVTRNFKPVDAPADRHHTVAHVLGDGEHLINMMRPTSESYRASQRRR